MLTEFATWWLRQMASLLLVPVQRWLGRPRNRAIVEPSASALDDPPPSVHLSRSHRGREQAIGDFALDEAGAAALSAAVRLGGLSQRVVLRVPSAELLVQPVSLPLAAERGIEQALAYDMDRLTPFRPDAVFWAWAIERRDRQHGRLHVLLSLIPQATLDPLMRRLQRAGIFPAMIEVGMPDGSLYTLALRHDPPRQLHRQRRAVQAAAVFCAILAGAIIGAPFVVQSLALSRVEEAIIDRQPKIAEVEALRRRIAGQANGADAVAQERARAGDALAALAAVTDILPDNTFLAEFSIAQRHIALSGQSTQAARLIPALSADPSIRNPSFAAPVTRTGNNGADIFSIRAELAP